MQEITKVFQKCIDKHELLKERFKTCFMESYEQAPQWQRDIIKEVLKNDGNNSS